MSKAHMFTPNHDLREECRSHGDQNSLFQLVHHDSRQFSSLQFVSPRNAISIFTDPHVSADAYLYALIIPVLPFALIERVHLHEDEVQQWIGILLAAYGAGLLIGSRKFLFQSVGHPPHVYLLMTLQSNCGMVRRPR